MLHYNNAVAGDITHTMEGKPSQGNDKVIGIAHGSGGGEGEQMTSHINTEAIIQGNSD